MSEAPARIMDEPALDDLVTRAAYDAEALGSLYDRYYALIFAYCSRRLFLKETAEDVTATVFLHVARHIRRFAGKTEADFRNWVYAIATHEVNTFVRVTRRRERILEAVRRERLQLETSRPQQDGGLHRLDWPRLYEAILQLDPRDQAVITLRFWQGLKHPEIAGVLGCSSIAVRVRLNRALARLRKALRAALG